MSTENNPRVHHIRNEIDLGVLVGELRKYSRKSVSLVTSPPLGATGLPFNQNDVCNNQPIEVFVLEGKSMPDEWSRRVPKQYRLSPGVSRLFPREGSIADEDEPPRSPYVSYGNGSKEACTEKILEAASRFSKYEAIAATAKASTVVNPLRESKAKDEVRFSLHGLNMVSESNALDAMLSLINSEDRDLAVIVATRRQGHDRTFIDMSALAKELDDTAWVFEVVGKPLEYRMSQRLNDTGNEDCEVYNGAIRLFTTPDRNQSLSSDRFLYRKFPNSDVGAISERIVSDVYGLRAQGWQQHPAPTGWRRVTATVIGILKSADRALLNHAGGTCVARADELLSRREERGLPITRVLQEGMVLTGRLDPRTKMLAGYADDIRISSTKAVDSYKKGETVLVRVVEAKYAKCTVALFPGVLADIPAEDVAGPGIFPSDVLREGQVIPALVVSKGKDEAPWTLSILEAESEAVIPAPPILTGGPSWLSKEDIDGPIAHEGPAVDSEYLSGEPLPLEELDVPSDAGEEATMYLRVLSRRLQQTEKKRTKLQEELTSSNKLNESLRKKLLDAKSAGGNETSSRYRVPKRKFSCSEEQRSYEAERMDWLIRDEWFRRFEPADRAARPLPKSWRYDEKFFDSLVEVDVSLSKVLRCMLDVLIRNTSSRQEHPLRTGDGGEDAARRTDDGSIILRCYVEQRKSQAARLHYSYRTDGTVTFHSVRKHDDMRT